MMRCPEWRWHILHGTVLYSTVLYCTVDLMLIWSQCPVPDVSKWDRMYKKDEQESARPLSFWVQMAFSILARRMRDMAFGGDKCHPTGFRAGLGMQEWAGRASSRSRTIRWFLLIFAFGLGEVDLQPPSTPQHIMR
jgi:hypothetical protein